MGVFRPDAVIDEPLEVLDDVSHRSVVRPAIHRVRDGHRVLGINDWWLVRAVVQVEAREDEDLLSSRRVQANKCQRAAVSRPLHAQFGEVGQGGVEGRVLHMSIAASRVLPSSSVM